MKSVFNLLKRKSVISAFVTAGVAVAGVFGYQMTTGSETALTENLVGIVSGIAGVITVVEGFEKSDKAKANKESK